MSINPMTFYRIDSARVFQRYMHDTVKLTMEEITKENGIRFDGGDKPRMRDMYDRT